MDSKIIFPHINLNGTGPKTLLEDYCNAWTAVIDAISVMRKIEFHPRDYMQQQDGGEVWKQASRQFEDRINKLQDIAEELSQIMEYISNRMR